MDDYRVDMQIDGKYHVYYGEAFLDQELQTRFLWSCFAIVGSLHEAKHAILRHRKGDR